MTFSAPDTTLQAIMNKTRRLTRMYTEAEITNNELVDYINTFMIYDMPEHVKLFSLTENFTFYTLPNVEVYDSTNTNYDPDVYIGVKPPLYIAGYESYFTQSQEEFFRIYPEINFSQSIGTGDGATVAFSTTLSNIPFLQSHVTLSSVDTIGNRLVAIDANGDGNLYNVSTTGTVGTVSLGTVNYTTGAVSISWLVAPGSNEDVTAQTIPYVASRPAAALFFNNQFTLRPVPDKAYRVDIEAFVAPSYLMETSDDPEIKQWWQYIAYGAAKKIFEDQLDTDSIAKIMPEMNQQQRLVLRKTIVQQTPSRTATIFTQQTNNGQNYQFGNGFNL